MFWAQPPPLAYTHTAPASQPGRRTHKGADPYPATTSATPTSHPLVPTSPRPTHSHLEHLICGL